MLRSKWTYGLLACVIVWMSLLHCARYVEAAFNDVAEADFRLLTEEQRLFVLIEDQGIQSSGLAAQRELYQKADLSPERQSVFLEFVQVLKKEVMGQEAKDTAPLAATRQHQVLRSLAGIEKAYQMEQAKYNQAVKDYNSSLQTKIGKVGQRITAFPATMEFGSQLSRLDAHVYTATLEQG